jgi:hypothetical protein
MRPLACWTCGFESRWEYGCLSLVSVVCCQVEIFASGWSLVQKSPADFDVSECVCVCVCVWVSHWVWSEATITLYTHNEQAEEVRLRKKEGKVIRTLKLCLFFPFPKRPTLINSINLLSLTIVVLNWRVQGHWHEILTVQLRQIKRADCNPIFDQLNVFR